MPELTPIELVLLAAMALAGIVAGWFLRSGRCDREKQAINDGWREQIAAQKSEHNRIAAQTKSLMEQISQFQASRKDSDLRARELTESLREAFARRDELQRQLKDIRANLESALAERTRLQNDMDQRAGRQEAASRSLRERDDKIARLNRELENWQNRLPPLIERFRTRDLEAQQLEVELDQARERIADLENLLSSGQTRIDPAESSPLANGLDASNEQYDFTSAQAVPDIDAPTGSDDVEATDSDTANEEAAAESVFDRLLAEDGVDLTPHDGSADHEAAEVFAAGDSGNDMAVDVSLDGAEGPKSLDYELPAADDQPGDRDDLQQIKGVGPAIEKTLNDLGIYRYEQIATLSEFEIDRVARQLKGFRSRIYREDWIGQARMLQQQKNPDQD